MNNIIITTHSKRLRQFINKYFYNFNKKLHFMNCCVIKLKSQENNGNYKVDAEIIYEGELDKYEDRKVDTYYDLKKFNSKNIFSDSIQIPLNVTIYLIRHAQGYHNLNSGLSRYIKIAHTNLILKDPQLTQIGITQALNCGAELKKYINSSNKNYFFCSKFLRTRETMSYIMSMLNINDKIRVLHYTHEIKSLKADDFKDFYENKHNQCKIDSDREKQKCDKVNNIKIDWKYFDKDLENVNFNYNSNMLYEAYFIIGKINKRDNEKLNLIKNMLLEI
jgi:broad specificity phosphatase PhoE